MSKITLRLVLQTNKDCKTIREYNQDYEDLDTFLKSINRRSCLLPIVSDTLRCVKYQPVDIDISISVKYDYGLKTYDFPHPTEFHFTDGYVYGSQGGVEGFNSNDMEKEFSLCVDLLKENILFLSRKI